MAQPGTAPRIERRLATIMAMNVAGYNRLMGIDEVGTLNALKDHRRERIDPTIARHNGRVFAFPQAIAEARLAIAQWQNDLGRNPEGSWLALIAAESENGQDAEARAALQNPWPHLGSIAAWRRFRRPPAAANQTARRLGV